MHGDAHMETLERVTFGGKMLGPWSAHPKTDPATGASARGSLFSLLPRPLPCPACLDDVGKGEAAWVACKAPSEQGPLLTSLHGRSVVERAAQHSPPVAISGPTPLCSERRARRPQASCCASGGASASRTRTSSAWTGTAGCRRTCPSTSLSRFSCTTWPSQRQAAPLV